jgi:hypothetical protein
MLLYGDNPPSGEPTLELVRRPLAGDAGPTAEEILERLLGRWGWEGSVADAVACVEAVLGAADGAESLELWAFRRAHQVTVEVHCTGCASTVAGTAAVADERASLWGVRPLPGGEAVWFEFR